MLVLYRYMICLNKLKNLSTLLGSATARSVSSNDNQSVSDEHEHLVECMPRSVDAGRAQAKPSARRGQDSLRRHHLCELAWPRATRDGSVPELFDTDQEKQLEHEEVLALDTAFFHQWSRRMARKAQGDSLDAVDPWESRAHALQTSRKPEIRLALRGQSSPRLLGLHWLLVDGLHVHSEGHRGCCSSERLE